MYHDPSRQVVERIFEPDLSFPQRFSPPLAVRGAIIVAPTVILLGLTRHENWRSIVFNAPSNGSLTLAMYTYISCQHVRIYISIWLFDSSIDTCTICTLICINKWRKNNLKIIFFLLFFFFFFHIFNYLFLLYIFIHIHDE